MQSRTFRTYAPPLLLMGVIFILSSIPGKIDNGTLRFVTELDPQLQNLLHIPMYGLLQWLWLRAFAKAGKSGGGTVLASIGITTAYGLFDEFHQLFVPGRYASLTDVLLNLVGVAAGTLVFRGIYPAHRGWST
jgi:glycopeptide antibiotics resistance protein